MDQIHAIGVVRQIVEPCGPPPGVAQAHSGDEKAAAGTCQDEAEIGDDLQADRTMVAVRHHQCDRHRPDHEGGEKRGQPGPPMAGQHSVHAEESALQAVSADSDAGEEIERIMQRAAQLERERADALPGPGRKRESQRHIGDGGERNEAGEIAQRMMRRPGGQLGETFAPVRRKSKHGGGGDVEDQKLPQEPGRPARPERQGTPVLPIGAHARVDRGDEVGGVESDRHQQIHRQDERQADPQEAVVQEHPAALAREARPHEQARHEEHERHQIHVLKRAENVEPEPPLAIDDGEGVPSKRRIVEGKWRIGQRPEIGQHGMEREHDQNDECTKVAECQTSCRHCAADVFEGRVGVSGAGDKVTGSDDRGRSIAHRPSRNLAWKVLLHRGQINSSGFPRQSGRPRERFCRQLNSLVKLLFDRVLGGGPVTLCGGRMTTRPGPRWIVVARCCRTSLSHLRRERQ